MEYTVIPKISRNVVVTTETNGFPTVLSRGGADGGRILKSHVKLNKKMGQLARKKFNRTGKNGTVKFSRGRPCTIGRTFM